jgi:hypothetical protein
MATPWHRLIWKSRMLAPSGSRIEKPWSRAAVPISSSVQEFQRRIEQVPLECEQMRPIEAPEEADLGHRELEMQDVSSSVVQKRLLELAQQVVQIIQAWNEDKEVVEDEFELLKANLEILETRIHTDKRCVDADVAGVGTQLQLQEAVLQELRSGVNISQGQDAQIVQDANDIVLLHEKKREAMSKSITDNASQIVAINGPNIRIQRFFKDMNSRIQQVNDVLDSIETSLREVASRWELREYATAMDEQLVQMKEVNTGLTTAMEGYKLSESSPYNF